MIALALWLCAAPASAQSVVQAPMHVTVAPSHRGYWMPGELRMLLAFDAGGANGPDYATYTARLTGAISMGVSRAVSWDLAIGGSIGGGNETGPYGARSGSFAGWLGGSTVQYKLAIGALGPRWRTWLVAFSGLTWGADYFIGNREDPDFLDVGRFDTRAAALSSPLGLFATFSAWQIALSPIAYIDQGWLVALRTKLGDPPTEVSKQVSLGDLTTSLGLDLTLEPSALTLGFTWSRTLGLGTMPAYDTYTFRLSVARRYSPDVAPPSL